ncbi:MAG: hypothetical protein JOY54_16105 [Acidobacteriaceae bacterium]|nr:hypothetical protein [Acidobacteriaceae bacterium]
MNARSIRRAQERRTAKQARKAAVMRAKAQGMSQTQLVADRPNAQVSADPRSETCETKSPLSLPETQVLTGLTGRTILLPTDEAEAYSRLIAAFIAKWQPVGEEEQRLVQSLVDTEWRLMRIPGLEAGIFALGRREFAETFNQESDEVLRRSLIEAQIFVAYERQLKNLTTQENRLRRQRQTDYDELQRLQQERRERASQMPEEIGFEFATVPLNEKVPHFEAFPSPLAHAAPAHAPLVSGAAGLTTAPATLEPFCGLSSDGRVPSAGI